MYVSCRKHYPSPPDDCPSRGQCNHQWDGVCPEEDEEDLCPDCGAPLRARMSGVHCTKCDYWFCF